MPRKSLVHYIAPSAISITPNCNESANDLAVSLIRGAKIKVFSPAVGLETEDGYFQEWTLYGRNRRLADSAGNDGHRYTIYARLPKANKDGGYLVFAQMTKDEDDEWVDKYWHVTSKGYSRRDDNRLDEDFDPDDPPQTDEDEKKMQKNNWWFRLGEVSEPSGGQRTVTLDTGILGTDQFNTEWNLVQEGLHVDLTCRLVEPYEPIPDLDPDDDEEPEPEGEDAGPTPYVPWGYWLFMKAELAGVRDDEVVEVKKWEITRSTGAGSVDWMEEDDPRREQFKEKGRIDLKHTRGGEGTDDFGAAVSLVFTVTAWGTKRERTDKDDEEEEQEPVVVVQDGDEGEEGDDGEILAMATITIMSETNEQYALQLSETIVNYDEENGFSPEKVFVHVRSTDQRTAVTDITTEQMTTARLSVEYALANDLDRWIPLTFEDSDPTDPDDPDYPNLVARAFIGGGGDDSVFYEGENIIVRLIETLQQKGEDGQISTVIKELSRKTILNYYNLGTKYVTVGFFKKLFAVHHIGDDGNDEIIETNRKIKDEDEDPTVNIEAKRGFWSPSYVSALGQGSGEGGGGAALEWPLQDINVADMPRNPKAGDTIVWDGTTFSWGKSGGGLKGLHLYDGATPILPTISGDNYSFDLGQSFLSLTRGGTVSGNVTINGANLAITNGTLTISHPQGFNPLQAADNVVLTKKETETVFDERYVTVNWFKNLFEAREQDGTEVKPNEDGPINNLKVLVGTWTQQYLSALGIGSDGGSGGVWYLSQLEDVDHSKDPQNNDTLIWDGRQWTFGTAGLDKNALNTLLYEKKLRIKDGNTLLGNEWNARDGGEIDISAILTGKKWWGRSLEGGQVKGSLDDVGNIIPDNAGPYSIGSDQKRFGAIYVDEIHVGPATISWDGTNLGLHLTKAMYSDEWVSALGTGSSGGSGGVWYLSMLEDVDHNDTPSSGDTLVFRNGLWRFDTAGIDTTELNNLLYEKKLRIKDGNTLLGNEWNARDGGEIDISAILTGKKWWGRSLEGGQVKGSLDDVGNITPDNAGPYSIGTSQKRFGAIYVNEIYIGDAKISWDDINRGVHLSKAVYSDEWVSALGTGSSGGSGGVWYLSMLEDVDHNDTPSSGDTLVFRNGLWRFDTAGIDTTELNNLLYAKKLRIKDGNTLLGSEWNARDGGEIDISAILTGKKWWGRSLEGGQVKGSLDDVGNISMNGAVTGATGIDSLMYFFTSGSNKQVKITAASDTASDTTIRPSTVGTYTSSGATYTPRLFVVGNVGVTEEVRLKGIDFAGLNNGTSSHGGYLDFNYGAQYANDFSTRIIESAAGVLTIKKSGSAATDVTGLVVGNSRNGDYIKIGGATLTWVAGKGLKIDTGFWSESFVSALGTGSSGGGGGINMSDVWTALAEYNTDHKINNSHINLNTLTINVNGTKYTYNGQDTTDVIITTGGGGTGGGLTWTDLQTANGHNIGGTSGRLDNLYGTNANLSGKVEIGSATTGDYKLFVDGRARITTGLGINTFMSNYQFSVDGKSHFDGLTELINSGTGNTLEVNGNSVFDGDITATKFIVDETSTGFLKANGSVDTSTYAKTTRFGDITIEIGSESQTFNPLDGTQTITFEGSTGGLTWANLAAQAPDSTSQQIHSSHCAFIGNYVLTSTLTTTLTSYALKSSLGTMAGEAKTNYWSKTEITTLKSYTTASNLGWVGTTEDAKKVVTSNALAFWNGLYDGNSTSSNTHSNLEYCKLGKFGALAVASATISSPTSGQVLKYDGSKWVNGTVSSTGLTWANLAAQAPDSTSQQIHSSHCAFIGNYVLTSTLTTTLTSYALKSSLGTMAGEAKTNYWSKTEITTLKSYTTASNLGWVGTTEDAKKVVTSNALAYWNGLYDGNSTSSNTHSNLEYCKLGKFGALAVASATISSPTSGQVLKYDGSKWVNGTVSGTGLTWTNLLSASGHSIGTTSNLDNIYVSGFIKDIDANGCELVMGHGAGTLTTNKYLALAVYDKVNVIGSTSNPAQLFYYNYNNRNIYLGNTVFSTTSSNSSRGKVFITGKNVVIRSVDDSSSTARALTTVRDGGVVIGINDPTNTDARFGTTIDQMMTNTGDKLFVDGSTVFGSGVRTLSDVTPGRLVLTYWFQKVNGNVNGSGTSNWWHRLGNYTFSDTGSQQIVIELFAGSGYNGNASQNSNAKITLKHAWQANPLAQNSVGVTCERYSATCNIEVRVNSITYNTGEVWILVPVDYGNGFYRISGTYTSWEHNGETPITSKYANDRPTADYTSGGVTTYVPNHNNNTVGYYSGGGSGDYLPLTGGTVTGDLTIASTSSAASKILYNSNDATLKIYPIDTTYGRETVAIQTCFDQKDPETASGTYDPSGSNGSRCVLALQPRGGNVGIGTATPSNYKLYVNGTGYFSGNVYSNSLPVLTSGTGVTLAGDQTVDGEKTFKKSILTSNSNTSLGSSSIPWGTVYCKNATIDKGTISISGTMSTMYIKEGKIYDPNNTIAIQAGGDTGTSNPKDVTICYGGGNVGIGAKVNSDCKLYINGSVGIKGYVVNSTYDYKLYVSGNSLFAGYVFIGSNADVRLERYAPASGRVYLNVNATSGITTNATATSSDIRKKNVVSMVENVSVEDIARAPIFNFTWKEGYGDSQLHLGTSAQYWQPILRNGVMDFGKDGLSMDYGSIALSAAVITARTVLSHEERIKALEAENKRLRTEIELLKAA